MKKQLLFLASGLLVSMSGFAQYCASNASSFADSKINQVTLAGNATTIQSPLSGNGGGCSNYTDYTALPAAELSLGFPYSVDILMGTCGGYQYSKYTKAWIDFNNDNDFTDPGEELGFINTGSGVTPGLMSISFNVPLTATAGVTTRMRIVCRESGSAFSTQPCGTYTWGETEDYSVMLLPPGLSALAPDTIELACYGDTTAAITPVVLGGTSPYTYAWSTGSTAASLSSLGAGSYALTVTDAVGDMDTAYIEVVQPDSIGLTTSVITSLICDYDISQAQAAGTGGTALTGYAWDTTSANYAWDTSGVPTVVPMSNNTVSAAQNIGFDFIFFGDTFNEFLIGSNGFISFNPTSPTGCCDGDPIPNPSASEPRNAIYAVWDYHTATASVYSYFVTGTAPFRSLVMSFENLPVCCGSFPNRGAAQIVLHETSNCIEINQEFSLPPTFGTMTQGIQNAAGTEAFTYPGRNGVLWQAAGNTHISFCPIDASGLLYTWSSGNVGANVYGLEAGTYTVTASDANGCSTTEDLTIAPGISVLVSALDAADVSCFGFDDATINPAITGGVSPVNYTWSNGASSATLASLQPGTYSVSAEDAVGCTIEVNNITIMEPAILVGSVYDIQNAICSNDENGSASIVVSGGVPPYSPVWSSGEIAYTATGLSAGANYVVVTDANGCEAFLSVNVLSDFDSPTPNIGNSLISANGAGVTLSTQPNTYSSYLWNTGATSATLLAANTGFYWVEVTNSAGCIGSDTAFVEVWPTGVAELKELAGVTMYPNPARDMINFNISSEINSLNVSIVDSKGSIVATRIFNNSGIQNISLENIAAGIYSVQFSDENGQMSTKRLVVSK